MPKAEERQALPLGRLERRRCLNIEKGCRLDLDSFASVGLHIYIYIVKNTEL